MVGDELLRGAPRFVGDPAAGPQRTIAFIPEVRVRTSGDKRAVAPVAVLELHEAGIKRHKLTDPNRAFARRLLAVGAAVLVACRLVGLVAGNSRRHDG